jgi:hypothetical protein
MDSHQQLYVIDVKKHQNLMGKKYELIETKLMWLFSNELVAKKRKESKVKKERN